AGLFSGSACLRISSVLLFRHASLSRRAACSMEVTDGTMTADAVELVSERVRVDGLDDCPVAAPTGALRDLSVERRDLDGLVERPRREVERVPEAVRRLHPELGDPVVMRRVAVVARRHAAVAR